MPRKRQPDLLPVEPRQFTSTEEIDRSITKIQRRIEELEKLDVRSAILGETAEVDVVAISKRQFVKFSAQTHLNSGSMNI
jgi:hypothetical protein